MKFSACIDMMFQYKEFPDRFAEVKNCGIDAVEFWKWTNKDMDLVCEKLAENSLAFSIFNIDSTNESLSYDLSRGILNKGRKKELVDAFYESVPVYKRLNAGGMIVLIGERIDGMSDEKQNENILECLCEVAPHAEKENINLFVEPLNAVDRQNYYMPYSAPLFDILRKVGSKNVKMLYDIYHQQTTEGHLRATIHENIDLIGHFHVADSPGRHEPGTGDINYPGLLSSIATLPYDGYIGLEYRATKNDSETLGFLKEITK